MSRCLRYQNPTIYQHLASHYVAGGMTPRVKARTETLLKTTPELDRAIAYWADQFSGLHERLPQAELSPETYNKLWNSIEAAIDESSLLNDKKADGHTPVVRFWDQLLIWRIASGTGALASVIFAILLSFNFGQTIPSASLINTPSVASRTASDISVVKGPSYLAAMSAHNDAASVAVLDGSAVQFVISAYGKTQGAASRLHLQWSKAHAGKAHPPLYLWAEDKDTGALSYIGPQPLKDKHWELTKPEWKAIANSRRLLMTSTQNIPSNNNTLFSGFCLQLKEWKS